MVDRLSLNKLIAKLFAAILKVVHESDFVDVGCDRDDRENESDRQEISYVTECFIF